NAPLFQRAGTEVFDHHVGLFNQLLDQFYAAFAFQVEGDGFLVATETAPPERGAAVVEFAPAANRVAAGRLDLDHLGAEIGEQGAVKRASKQLAQFDNTNAGERL